MSDAVWGLLGPESLPSSRRIRTLGLGAAVRSFNELAVPGLGGVWFGKQIVLALLGVEVASRAGARNIEVANAIEALSCWLALNDRAWAPEPRLLGNRKLRSRSDLRFKAVRKRSFYVTQPMRTASVETLPSLSLVESPNNRFNAFVCTDEGLELIRAALDERPYKRSVDEHLILWVHGSEERVQSPALVRSLSPVEALTPKARSMLRDRLLRKGPKDSDETVRRRRDALAWVDARRAGQATGASWSDRPDGISAAHWNDLEAGARLFTARDAALAVLDALECRMPAERRLALDKLTAELVAKPLAELRDAAQAFLDIGREDEGATSFCRECTHADPTEVLAKLIARDDRVLRLQGARICAGPAFRGGTPTDEAEQAESDASSAPDAQGFPEGISPRVRNLFLLNLDLHGELSNFLAPEDDAEDRP